jgi:hypothetical protein
MTLHFDHPHPSYGGLGNYSSVDFLGNSPAGFSKISGPFTFSIPQVTVPSQGNLFKHVSPTIPSTAGDSVGYYDGGDLRNLSPEFLESLELPTGNQSVSTFIFVTTSAKPLFPAMLCHCLGML